MREGDRYLKEIALVAIDLDGTLLTRARSLAPEGACLLRQAAQRGVRVVLATTRNPRSVRPFCHTLGIDDPIICTNGAQVWASPDGPVWAYHTIPREIALVIAGRADTQGWELSTTVGSMTYWRQRPDQALAPIAPDITVVPTNTDAIVDEPARILTSQRAAIDSIRALCRSGFSGRCRTETYYRTDGAVHSLCVLSPHADKGMALALVCDRLGTEREQIVAIGDNPNDLPMFTYASVSVAMGNAPSEVKRGATAVAPRNDEEGVAWALRTFVL